MVILVNTEITIWLIYQKQYNLTSCKIQFFEILFIDALKIKTKNLFDLKCQWKLLEKKFSNLELLPLNFMTWISSITLTWDNHFILKQDHVPKKIKWWTRLCSSRLKHKMSFEKLSNDFLFLNREKVTQMRKLKKIRVNWLQVNKTSLFSKYHHVENIYMNFSKFQLL